MFIGIITRIRGINSYSVLLPLPIRCHDVPANLHLLWTVPSKLGRCWDRSLQLHSTPSHIDISSPNKRRALIQRWSWKQSRVAMPSQTTPNIHFLTISTKLHGTLVALPAVASRNLSVQWVHHVNVLLQIQTQKQIQSNSCEIEVRSSIWATITPIAASWL